MELGVNRLYLNDGTGRLSYVPDAFGTVMHDSEHVRAGDFDGDGNMDVVFVAEADEVHQLFLGNGKGGFVDASDRLPANSQGNAVAIGDVARMSSGAVASQAASMRIIAAAPAANLAMRANTRQPLPPAN